MREIRIYQGKPTPWPARDNELKELWSVRPSITFISRLMGLSPGQVAGRAMRLNLHFDRHGVGQVLDQSHAAVTEGRTRSPSRRDAVYGQPLLKRGYWQRKLGAKVTKGKWKGMQIYSLTLEERATCPRDCAMWRSCFGNNMPHSIRHAHGPQLEVRLWRELEDLQRRHPAGFVIRLHILGDFYSVGYVEFWAEALDAFPGLRVFGYTAWKPHTRVGRAVAALRDRLWSRFAIRTSGAVTGPRTAVVEDLADVPKGAVLCPAQTGKTDSCGSCTVCWASQKPVAFLQH